MLHEMSVVETLEEIREEETEATGISKDLVDELDDGPKITREKLMKHEEKFVRGVERLEEEMNDILEKLEGVEEEVYELEEKEDQKISDLSEEIGDDETELKNALDSLYDLLLNYIENFASAKDWGSEAGFAAGAARATANYDRHVEDENIKGADSGWDEEAVLEDLDAILRDLRRLYHVISTVDNIEEYDEENLIPVLETIRSEIDRINSEKHHLESILHNIEKVDDKSPEINQLEQQASTLIDKIETVVSQYKTLKNRYENERNKLVEEVTEVHSITNDKLLSRDRLKETSAMFSSNLAQNPKDGFGNYQGNLSMMRKSGEIQDKIKEVRETVIKLRNASKSLKREIYEERGYFNHGPEAESNTEQTSTKELAGV